MRQLNSSNEHWSGWKTIKGEGGGADFKAKKIGFSSITQMEILFLKIGLVDYYYYYYYYYYYFILFYLNFDAVGLSWPNVM